MRLIGTWKRSARRAGVVAALALLTAMTPGVSAVAQTPPRHGVDPNQQHLVGGAGEPAHLHPWVLHAVSDGCGGVLIHPQWVLTAAHCVEGAATRPSTHAFTFSRIDPASGQTVTETRNPDQTVGLIRANRGVFIPQEYLDGGVGRALHDIALVKLERPFRIVPLMQTVGLPAGPRQAGMRGMTASIPHGFNLPTGQTAVMRGPIAEIGSPFIFAVLARDAGASGCPGDSGSGFVTVENGRAVVRGVAFEVTLSDCKTPAGETAFTDVYAHRAWILATIGDMGNTTYRRVGPKARGFMRIDGCGGIQWAPLEVSGAEIRTTCRNGGQTFLCELQGEQSTGRDGAPRVARIRLTTWMSNGETERRSFSTQGTALRVHWGFPLDAVRREAICETMTDSPAVQPPTEAQPRG